MTYNIPSLPPCPTEDSDNCVWLASEQGNGQGQSFYTIMGDTTYFAEPIGTLIDPAPIIYAVLTIAITLVILRLRAITIRKNRK
jgi:hypothetical protein